MVDLKTKTEVLTLRHPRTVSALQFVLLRCLSQYNMSLSRWDSSLGDLVLSALSGRFLIVARNSSRMDLNPPESRESTSAAAKERASRKGTEDPMLRRVEVRNLPQVVDEDDLITYFETKFGTDCVSACRIYRNQTSAISSSVGNMQFKASNVTGEAVIMSKNGLLELYNRKLELNVLDQRRPTRPTTAADNRIQFQDCTLHFGCLKTDFQMVAFSHFQGLVELEVDEEWKTLSLYITSRKKQIQFKMEFQDHDIFRLRILHHEHLQSQNFMGFLLQIKETPPHLFCRQIGSDVTGDSFAETVRKVLVTTKDSGRDSGSSAWTRTTDFTGKHLVGQSFAYMLEAKAFDKWQEDRLMELLNFWEKLEHGRSLLVERGAPYAVPQEVVPVLRSEKLQKFPIPFDLTFKINHLIQHGKLNATTFDEQCATMLISSSEGHVRMALQTISQLQPHQKLDDSKALLISSLERAKAQSRIPPEAPQPGKGRSWIYRLLVTPTKVFCQGREVEPSNRMIRLHEKHADHFLRVNFVDEDLGPLNSSSLISAENTTYTSVYRRIKTVLREGFSIGNKHYSFLAFSASQLREGQVWMFANVMINGRPQITAESLRAEMGDFSQILNVAKCAARMGQCFSSSKQTLTVLPLQVKKIDDIFVSGDGKYCFSDGIGKISVDFACKVAAMCGCPGKVPSAFQIRYGGYKGVVAVDPSVSNTFKLYLRPSMRKFDSPHFGLDVLEWTRPLPCYLNRQAISLLSTLGVKDTVFVDLQDRMVEKWFQAVNDVTLAKRLLEETESNSIALPMLNSGFTFESEPLLRRLMLSYMNAQFNEIKTRARIFVPEGRLLMGCLDETGILKYGQAFVQISSSADEMKANSVDSVRIIQQEIIVVKNPCLHPGDVRVLKCVNVRQLQHMVDCIVFPQRGPRPHPNECSGSDLDGDKYLVSWNQSLLPPTVDPPMDYESPPARQLSRQVTTEGSIQKISTITYDIQQFFVDYMVNDNLGIISNAHVVHCDREPEKARSAKCLELAHLASLAVDFPKTGIPAVIPWYLRPKKYPDFMEKDHKAAYASKGILGKLYRCTKNVPEPAAGNSPHDYYHFCDPDFVIRGHAQFLDRALGLKDRYDAKLMQFMNQYGIKDEVEILGGHIINLSPVYKRRQTDVVPKIVGAFERLKSEARSWFHEFKEWRDLRLDQFAWVSAWFVATYHEDYYGKRHLQYSEATSMEVYLISFPWVLHDLLCLLKSLKAQRPLTVAPFEGSTRQPMRPDHDPERTFTPTSSKSYMYTSDDPASLVTNLPHRATSTVYSNKRKATDSEEPQPSAAQSKRCEIAETANQRDCSPDPDDEEIEID